MRKCVCQKQGVEFWAVIPDDERGEKYQYPLFEAEYCPVCGLDLLTGTARRVIYLPIKGDQCAA